MREDERAGGGNPAAKPRGTVAMREEAGEDGRAGWRRPRGKTAGHSGNAGGGGAGMREDEGGWERMREDGRGWERMRENERG